MHQLLLGESDADCCSCPNTSSRLGSAGGSSSLSAGASAGSIACLIVLKAGTVAEAAGTRRGAPRPFEDSNSASQDILEQVATMCAPTVVGRQLVSGP